MQLTTKKFILTILIFTLAITGVFSQGKKDALPCQTGSNEWQKNSNQE